MKKILLSLAAATMTLAASAYTLDTPIFYEENFVEMSKVSDFPTDGWLTLGNGAKPYGNTAKVFDPDGKGPYYVIYDVGSESIAVANTDFENGVRADEWLISPEIEVPYDVSSLYFKAYSYTAEGGIGSPMGDARHTFKVMVSEGGTERSDFTEIFSNSVRNSGSANFESAEKICSINGYQGKKVRIAFVVDGAMQGFTGFSNIRWGQYILYVDSNLTSELAEVNEPVSIDYNIKLKAPVNCPYLNAQLFINDELVKEEAYKKAFGTATSYVAVIQRMQFKNIYTPADETPLAYKLVMTPDFEGAIPSVIEGGFGFPKVLYKNNVVVEEMTGAACGFCPRGIAALEYYHKTYPGSETQGKVINIGVHNTTFGADPMAEGNERYNISVAEYAGTNMPCCTMNRATRGTDPSNAGELDKLINLTSHNEATIVEVQMPEGFDGYDLNGKTSYVTFDVKNGFNATVRDLSAAIVLIENDVKGNNSSYNQHNYLNTLTDGQQAVTTYSSLGAIPAMAPYLNVFTSAGALGSEDISYSKMVYQHVSRGIFPSFSGEPIGESWVADVPQRFTMEFALPKTILNINNTEVAVLIINNTDRTIVASDIFPASKYTDLSGVSEVSADSAINIAKEGNNIKVNAVDGSLVDVYSLDGSKLGAYKVANGCLNVASPAKGLVVVKVSNASAVKTSKLIF